MKKNAVIMAASAALLILAIATYKVYDIHATRGRLVALVKDANDRLKSALQAESADAANVNIESSVEAAEADLVKLRNMNTDSVRAFADATDEALVSNREIMRRQSAMKKARAGLTVHLDGLGQHIKSDRGAHDWTREAVRLKSAVDKDFRDYRIAVESYSSLLESYPATQAKLAAFVDRKLLVDEKLFSGVRQRTLDAFTRAEQDIKRVATLQTYRVVGTRKAERQR